MVFTYRFICFLAYNIVLGRSGVHPAGKNSTDYKVMIKTQYKPASTLLWDSNMNNLKAVRALLQCRPDYYT
jgi:hypothetical protein